MSIELNPMGKFNFLLGTWELYYKVPKSQFSDYDTGSGKGEFKSILNDQYISFDYEAKLTSGEASAHAVFAWDKHTHTYKYWWFEDSGEFMQATCRFINSTTLCFNWHNTLMVQTFELKENGDVMLEMRYPKNKIEYEVVMDVLFKRI